MNPKTINCPKISSEINSYMSQEPNCFRSTARLILGQYWLGKNSLPKERAHAFVGSSPSYLSIYVFMNDSHIFSHATADNQKMWTLGDVTEVFIKPGVDREDYWEFHVTPNDFLMDIHIGNRKDYNNGKISWSHVISAESGATKYVNVCDGFWTTSLNIPWTAFGYTARPNPESRWQIAVCRYNYNGSIDNKPELSSTAALSQLSFHRYEEFTTVIF